MLSFLKKDKDPLRQKVKDLKCRQIHFVDDGYDEVAAAMESDPTALLKLSPVNYYAVKEKYIMAKVYSSKDFEENYAELSATQATRCAPRQSCLRWTSRPSQRRLQKWV